MMRKMTKEVLSCDVCEKEVEKLIGFSQSEMCEKCYVEMPPWVKEHQNEVWFALDGGRAAGRSEFSKHFLKLGKGIWVLFEGDQEEYDGFIEEVKTIEEARELIVKTAEDNENPRCFLVDVFHDGKALGVETKVTASFASEREPVVERKE